MNEVMIREKSINIQEHIAKDNNQEYRYKLTRYWDKGDKVVSIIMSNPSDASYLLEDKTAMNVNNFFILEGYNKINIVNLFAYRSKDISNLKYKNSTYESLNNKYIKEAFDEADLIVVGWGYGKENKNATYKNKIKEVKDILSKYTEKEIKCFKDEKGKINSHPQNLNLQTWSLVDYNLVL